MTDPRVSAVLPPAAMGPVAGPDDERPPRPQPTAPEACPRRPAGADVTSSGPQTPRDLWQTEELQGDLPAVPGLLAHWQGPFPNTGAMETWPL